MIFTETDVGIKISINGVIIGWVCLSLNNKYVILYSGNKGRKVDKLFDSKKDAIKYAVDNKLIFIDNNKFDELKEITGKDSHKEYDKVMQDEND